MGPNDMRRTRFSCGQSHLNRSGLWHLSEDDDAAAVVWPNLLPTLIDLHHGRGCNKNSVSTVCCYGEAAILTAP